MRCHRTIDSKSTTIFLLAIAASSFVVIANAQLATTSSWEKGVGHRRTRLTVPLSGTPGFTALPSASTQVTFSNRLDSAALARNQILEVGSGVALGDVNGDGRIDLYFCAIQGTNRLYLNLGDWKFEDITTQAGVECVGQHSTGAVFADIDGDGDSDLLVNAIGGGTRLFINQGRMRFEESQDAGLNRTRGSTSMALADIDGDGYLDLYVANYHTRTIKDSTVRLEIEAGFVGNDFIIKPPGLFLPLFLKSGGVNLSELGESDILYRNNRNGRFVPISWTNGAFLNAQGKPLTEAPKDWGLAVAFRDLNGDGAPDLYVCNDFFHSPDRGWINDGSGIFRALPTTALRHTSLSSMAVDFADIDRDGDDDFLVLDMMSRDHTRRHRQRGSLIHLQVNRPIRDPESVLEFPRNTLFLNRGDATYSEIAQYSGIEASEWSWSVVFLDVDLDGFEDILITNGNVRDANDGDLAKSDGNSSVKPRSTRSTRPTFPPLETANLAFRNQGDRTFQECGRAWGFDTFGISHGMAVADLDNDGDLDVVVNHLNQAAGLYRNNSSAPRVAVRTKGRSPNHQGIGARVELLNGTVPLQSQEMICGSRYLSGDDPMRVFAAASSKSNMTLRVTWRGGSVSTVENVVPNHLYEVEETDTTGTAPPSNGIDRPSKALSRSFAPNPPETQHPPLFENLSDQLRQPHRDPDTNIPESQTTLVRSLAHLGPGVAWRDLDVDGWEDLLVGGAQKGYGLVYINDRLGGFKAMRRRDPLIADQTGLLTFINPEGNLEFLAGLSFDPPTAKAWSTVASYRQINEAVSELFPRIDTSIGPLALGFVGEQLALFVGARFQPGRYPQPASSQLYVRQGDHWICDHLSTATLSKAGMVSGAVWADLNGDGNVSLVLACEWGPIRVFSFSKGHLVERTSQWRLENYRGRWNGVAAGDFNGDGRLDLLASNWGRNTKYERHRHHPIRLYFGDWQKLGQIEMLEAYYDLSLKKYVPFTTLDALRITCPALAERFPTFAAYSQASIGEIVGLTEQEMAPLEINWLESTIFLNRGEYFDTQVLPSEAQFAPAMGVSIGDLDGDGREDAFLSQNFFGDDSDSTRQDAGSGLWLRGDGHGSLSAVNSRESGITLTGEQRGTALCDFDQDGDWDLAVGQNDGPIALFRNAHGKAGLRVQLRGPSWNRDAIGATLRLKYDDQFGPVRSAQIGSGYWSQESPIHVMSASQTPTGVWIRWPGGRVSEIGLSPGRKEIIISSDRP